MECSQKTGTTNNIWGCFLGGKCLGTKALKKCHAIIQMALSSAAQQVPEGQCPTWSPLRLWFSLSSQSKQTDADIMLFVKGQEETLWLLMLVSMQSPLGVFQSTLPPLVVYIKLNSLGISISSENKSVCGWGLLSTHCHSRLWVTHSSLTHGSQFSPWKDRVSFQNNASQLLCSVPFTGCWELKPWLWVAWTSCFNFSEIPSPINVGITLPGRIAEKAEQACGVVATLGRQTHHQSSHVRFHLVSCVPFSKLTWEPLSLSAKRQLDKNSLIRSNDNMR